jgi:LemA protein
MVLQFSSGLIVPGCLLVLVLFFAVWTTAMYNGLVRLRNFVRESWAQIDTELKRRYNLIPNLMETVKGYMGHERDTLENVTKARAQALASQGTPGSQAQDENFLAGALKSLFAVAEAYPDLKANTNFLDMQRQLEETEDRIQAARRLYNANVRNLNTRIELFPSNIIASVFGFGSEEYFEVEEATLREAPKVDFTRPAT